MKAPVFKRVKRYASVIIRWVMIGTIVFCLTMAAGYYVTNHMLTKVYTASSVVRVPASDLATPTGTSLTTVAYRPEFENTMMSPELLLSVVKDLGLEKAWAQRLYKTDQEDLPDVDALTRIDRLVKVEVKRGTNLVEITAASDVPQEAADIANAIAASYQSLRGAQAPLRLNERLEPVDVNPVRIIQSAVPPTAPSKPDRGLDFVITFVAACVLALLVASFVEMVLLFVRAGEREEG